MFVETTSGQNVFRDLKDYGGSKGECTGVPYLTQEEEEMDQVDERYWKC